MDEPKTAPCLCSASRAGNIEACCNDARNYLISRTSPIGQIFQNLLPEPQTSRRQPGPMQISRRPQNILRAVLMRRLRSEEHTSELQSLMRISYAVFCLKKKTNTTTIII